MQSQLTDFKALWLLARLFRPELKQGTVGDHVFDDKRGRYRSSFRIAFVAVGDLQVEPLDAHDIDTPGRPQQAQNSGLDGEFAYRNQGRNIFTPVFAEYDAGGDGVRSGKERCGELSYFHVAVIALLQCFDNVLASERRITVNGKPNTGGKQDDERQDHKDP